MNARQDEDDEKTPARPLARRAELHPQHGVQRQLTDKQRAFVAEYLRNGSDAAKAYRKAYNSKASPQNAGKEGGRLLKHRLIAPRIGEAERKSQEHLARTADRYAISKERIAGELAKLAFSNPRDIFEWTEQGVTLKPSATINANAAAVITEISEAKTQAGGTIKVKLADKRTALMDLAKLMGYVVEKKERHIRHLADLSREELEALLADVKAGIKPADPTHH